MCDTGLALASALSMWLAALSGGVDVMTPRDAMPENTGKKRCMWFRLIEIGRARKDTKHSRPTPPLTTCLERRTLFRREPPAGGDHGSHASCGALRPGAARGRWRSYSLVT
uniref:Secreted protein n=1 Tax=Rhipicephalus zambeziensis TaxID=60191 RepID=A0A224Y7N3_9ACAR